MTSPLSRMLDHVKVVGSVSYAAIFPACRAVVHHGGAGTTAAGLRAGIPTLILWNGLDQPIWAAASNSWESARARRFSDTTAGITGCGPSLNPHSAICHSSP